MLGNIIYILQKIKVLEAIYYTYIIGIVFKCFKPL